MLLKTDITDWLKHPVTEEMLRLFQKHLEDNKGSLEDIVLAGSISAERIQDIAQLRGGILTLEQMLNIKEYLLDLVEEYPNEGDKDELSSLRTQSPIESQKV